MICVNDDALARRALLLRSWGRTSSLFVESETIENRFNVELDGFAYDAKFVFEELGYNLEPSEIGAAFGLVQLDKLERQHQRAGAQLRRATRLLQELRGMVRPAPATSRIADGLARLPADAARRCAVHAARDADLPGDAGHPDPPRLHRQHPAAARHGGRGIARATADGYPVADAVMRGGILLACHHGLKAEQLDYMHESFREFAKSFTGKRATKASAARSDLSSTSIGI